MTVHAVVIRPSSSVSLTGDFDGAAYGIPHQTRLVFTEAAPTSVLSLFATFYSQISLSLMQGPHPAWAPGMWGTNTKRHHRNGWTRAFTPPLAFNFPYQ